jgi:hypothetical protein
LIRIAQAASQMVRLITIIMVQLLLVLIRIQEVTFKIAQAKTLSMKKILIYLTKKLMSMLIDSIN